ncbi:BQ5605_C016g08254 [Microbotryum silenes-dioicae]|uniref:BQ5605_C016g08254 protein n=1 Tax=Microbotryum silenes-dioicae TaxID=796604 RepID=A0A2X0LZN2_9BASI|nr:BQ5605_C016g08254 [Microbotryum silenes-dioicae]
MAITARPRRSTARTVSYVNLFAIASTSGSSSSSSGDSDSDEEGEGSSGGHDASDRKPSASTSKGKSSTKKAGKSEAKSKGKGKGKGRAASSDEDSGSVFGSSDAAEEAADDDDKVDELLEASDDDEAGSEPERSDAGSSDRDANAGPAVKMHRKVLKPTAARGSSSGKHTRTRTDHVHSRRAQPPRQKRKTLLDPNWSSIGASYEPPYRALDEGTDSSPWTIRDEGETAETIDDEAQSKFMEAWAMHPFGLHKSLLRDNAWEKGKWTATGMSPKWGGWYDSKPSTSVLSAEECTVYLPTLVYPSRPTKVYLGEELAAEVDHHNEANSAAMPVDEDEGEAGDDHELEEWVKIWVGPLFDKNEQQLVHLKRFETHRLDEYLPNKPGHILNAGGPVSGLAWCPRPDPAPSTEYLAVSCFCSAEATLKMTKVPGPTMIQIWSLDTSDPSDISLVTSSSAEAQMNFEMALCVDQGDAWELKWCPRGGDRTKLMDHDETEESLGLLGGVFEDGSLAVFTVPNPVEARKQHKMMKTLYLAAKPTLRMELPDTKCTCFDWASYETIVAGCNNGWVAVWSVGDALRSGGKIQTARPTHYFNVHFAIIRSIAVIRVPPLSTALDGTLDLDGEPTIIATTGYDGSVFKTDLRDLSSVSLMHHERSTGIALAYCSQSGLLLSDDPEARVRGSVLKPNKSAARVWLSAHTGPIWSIASSPHHPFAASASADGCLIIANTIRPNRDRIVRGNYSQKVYRLDFHRRLGEYRMIDNMLPEARPTADSNGKIMFRGSMSTASWSPEVGIARVAWHPALDRCALLASGTMCGLVRVDWCEGGKGVA